MNRSSTLFSASSYCIKRMLSKALDESLEAKALRQFDALVERGELLWRTTTPQLIKAEPFNVSHSFPAVFILLLELIATGVA